MFFSKMRAVFTFLSFLLFFSCEAPESPKNAEETLRSFQLAVNVLDVSKAQNLATAQCKTQLQLLGVFMKMSSDEEIAAKKKELFTEIKSIKCSGDAPKLTCIICCTTEGKEKTANLIQQNGKWLVDMHFGMSDQ
jgi:hypothetical protein